MGSVSNVADTSSELITKLVEIVGRDNVLLGEDRHFYVTDVYSRIAIPMAVVKPGTTEEMRLAVAAAYATDVAIVIRGGGASYTGGYLPTSPRSILIDVGRLNRILEINERDKYVTVEPGVTWAQLDTTLQAQNLRVPFRGPFSGLAATVGGSISQNTLGHGSNIWGLSAESVIALEVIVANGELLKTGQAGSLKGIPFYRFYGPDLAGLFTGDCGALGVKAKITLRLIRRRPKFGASSFSFASFEDMHSTIAELAGYVIDDKAFGLDTALQQGQIGKNADAGSRIAIAKAIIQAAPSKIGGLAQVIRLGLAGSGAIAKAPYAAHYMIEGWSAGEIRTKRALVTRIATQRGREIPNAVPMVVRAMPFAPLHNTLGPAGERWVPLHGILPHSAVLDFHREIDAYINGQTDAMARNGVHIGRMFSPVGAGNFLYEPAMYWRDQQTVYHRTVLDEAYRNSIPSYPPNAAGADLIAKMRTDMVAMFHRHGAGHLQVGKTYPLLRDRNPSAVDLIRAVKDALDPKGLMNPGALGL